MELGNPLVIALATVVVTGLAINELSDLKNWIFGFSSSQDQALTRMESMWSTFTKEWAQVQKNTTNALHTVIYSIRVPSMMFRVRNQFRNELTYSMDKLIIDGKISKGLARIGDAQNQDSR